ncbi:hypothetical protein ACFQS1_39885 [Paractinoplanes rhizophilus]|uniref:Uncharacterized protein n=1 Tax=Paractinoplanes rhizophilus TaxID=1416877 RepID=A0ABW2I5H8_9ACTN
MAFKPGPVYEQSVTVRAEDLYKYFKDAQNRYVGDAVVQHLQSMTNIERSFIQVRELPTTH